MATSNIELTQFPNSQFSLDSEDHQKFYDVERQFSYPDGSSLVRVKDAKTKLKIVK